MFKNLANWILSALSIFVVATYLPGFYVDSLTTALIVALVLGLVNAIIKPMVSILALPITILTLGLFSFIISALFLLGVSYLVPGFTIDGFVPALIAAALLWFINLIIHLVSFPVKAS